MSDQPEFGDLIFHDKGLAQGVWHGRVTGATLPQRVCLVLEDRLLSEAALRPDAEGGADIAMPIPPEGLGDGLTRFRLMADMGAPRDALLADAQSLAALAFLAGDLQAEIMLMRSEIDLLKQSLRELANG